MRRPDPRLFVPGSRMQGERGRRSRGRAVRRGVGAVCTLAIRLCDIRETAAGIRLQRKVSGAWKLHAQSASPQRVCCLATSSFGRRKYLLSDHRFACVAAAATQLICEVDQSTNEEMFHSDSPWTAPTNPRLVWPGSAFPRACAQGQLRPAPAASPAQTPLSSSLPSPSPPLPALSPSRDDPRLSLERQRQRIHLPRPLARKSPAESPGAVPLVLRAGPDVATG